jgi:xylulokinase
MSMLGIDLGTGSVKCAVVDASGQVLASASQTYRVSSPQPGWAESDPLEWLSATRAAVKRALANSNETPTSVGFSGQMHGVVVVGKDLKPLRSAILWADGRATKEAGRMAGDLGVESLSRLGSPAVPGFAATTLAWLKQHEPKVLDRASHVLQPKDWLRVALGGEIATDPSDASGTLLFDVGAGQWSEEALDWCGIDPALLPPVRASQSAGGNVRLDGHDLMSAIGGADTACVVSGLGLVAGQGFIAVGSGSQTVRVLERPDFDQSLSTHTFALVGDPGAGWYRIGAVQNAGLSLTTALNWFSSNVDEATCALAKGIRDDDPIFVPYIAGERTPFMNANLRGSWHGLSLGTDRAAMLRSILVGVAQAVALGTTGVVNTGVSMPRPTPLVGGGTHDPLFRQLLADTTGLTLAIMDAPDAAVIGAALLGAGRTSVPVPAGSSDVVVPNKEAMERLRVLREIMIQKVMEQEHS